MKPSAPPVNPSNRSSRPSREDGPDLRLVVLMTVAITMLSVLIACIIIHHDLQQIHVDLINLYDKP